MFRSARSPPGKNSLKLFIGIGNPVTAAMRTPTCLLMTVGNTGSHPAGSVASVRLRYAVTNSR